VFDDGRSADAVTKFQKAHPLDEFRRHADGKRSKLGITHGGSGCIGIAFGAIVIRWYEDVYPKAYAQILLRRERLRVRAAQVRSSRNTPDAHSTTSRSPRSSPNAALALARVTRSCGIVSSPKAGSARSLHGRSARTRAAASRRSRNAAADAAAFALACVGWFSSR